MALLTGEYDHAIDDKNRIRIPTRLKGDAEHLYFTKGTNSCIFVFTEETFEAKIAQLNEIAMGDADRQKGVRMFIKSAILVDVDNQGRLVVPAPLREFAKLKKDIKVCGAGTHVEIWAKEVFDAYYAEEDADFDAAFNKLGI
ncbi:MAG: division/cell wall cluster transcriptional repressor MraZ [Clostridia bacterium]|nr:division/cell wall cluster transcriptional repressor MraZ [Clostridia bacterium]